MQVSDNTRSGLNEYIQELFEKRDHQYHEMDVMYQSRQKELKEQMAVIKQQAAELSDREKALASREEMAKKREHDLTTYEKECVKKEKELSEEKEAFDKERYSKSLDLSVQKEELRNQELELRKMREDLEYQLSQMDEDTKRLLTSIPEKAALTEQLQEELERKTAENQRLRENLDQTSDDQKKLEEMKATIAQQNEKMENIRRENLHFKKENAKLRTAVEDQTLQIAGLRQDKEKLQREKGDLFRQLVGQSPAEQIESGNILSQENMDSEERRFEKTERSSKRHIDTSTELLDEGTESELLQEKLMDEEPEGRDKDDSISLDEDSSHEKDTADTVPEIVPAQPLRAEEFQHFLKTEEPDLKVTMVHSDEGEYVGMEKEGLKFVFAFQEEPYLDICKKVKYSRSLKKKIEKHNAEDNKVEFLYDSEEGEIIVTTAFRRIIDQEELLTMAEELADQYFEAGR